SRAVSFSFPDSAPTDLSTLSLHDALPILSESRKFYAVQHLSKDIIAADSVFTITDPDGLIFGLMSSSMLITWQRTVGGRLKSDLDRKSTRLNSSHVSISYAVFCLKKKKII